MPDSIQIRELKEHTGAEVLGLNLRKPVSAEALSCLQHALASHVALVFRKQDFAAAQCAEAMGQFGELMEEQNRR